MKLENLKPGVEQCPAGWRPVLRDGKKVVWRCSFGLKRRDESAYKPAALKVAKQLLSILNGKQTSLYSQYTITATGQKISDYIKEEAAKLLDSNS